MLGWNRLSIIGTTKPRGDAAVRNVVMKFLRVSGMFGGVIADVDIVQGIKLTMKKLVG
jgi:hypothetical protein